MYQNHDGHPAMDVRFQRTLAHLPIAEEDSEEFEAILETIRENFWNVAGEIAKSILLDAEIIQGGRSGGWLEVHNFDDSIELGQINLRIYFGMIEVMFRELTKDEAILAIWNMNKDSVV